MSNTVLVASLVPSSASLTLTQPRIAVRFFLHYVSRGSLAKGAGVGATPVQYPPGGVEVHQQTFSPRPISGRRGPSV